MIHKHTHTNEERARVKLPIHTVPLRNAQQSDWSGFGNANLNLQGIASKRKRSVNDHCLGVRRPCVYVWQSVIAVGCHGDSRSSRCRFDQYQLAGVVSQLCQSLRAGLCHFVNLEVLPKLGPRNTLLNGFEATVQAFGEVPVTVPGDEWFQFPCVDVCTGCMCVCDSLRRRNIF